MATESMLSVAQQQEASSSMTHLTLVKQFKLLFEKFEDVLCLTDDAVKQFELMGFCVLSEATIMSATS